MLPKRNTAPLGSLPVDIADAIDNAERMTHSLCRLTLLGCLAAIAGCGLTPNEPLKIIATSPEGRPKVYLTSAEAASAAMEPGLLPVSGVVQATYVEPIAGQPQLKPFTEWSEQEAAAEALGRSARRPSRR